MVLAMNDKTLSVIIILGLLVVSLQSHSTLHYCKIIQAGMMSRTYLSDTQMSLVTKYM